MIQSKIKFLNIIFKISLQFSTVYLVSSDYYIKGTLNFNLKGKESSRNYEVIDFKQNIRYSINVVDGTLESYVFSIDEDYNYYSIGSKILIDQVDTLFLGYPAIKRSYSHKIYNWDDGSSLTEVTSISADKLLSDFFPSNKYYKLLRGIINQGRNEIDAQTVSKSGTIKNTVSRINLIKKEEIDVSKLLSKLKEEVYDKKLESLLINIAKFPSDHRKIINLSFTDILQGVIELSDSHKEVVFISDFINDKGADTENMELQKLKTVHIPTELYEYGEIQSLDFSSVPIGEISEDILKLKNLSELILYGTYLDIGYIEKTLCKMKSLRKLDIRHCTWTEDQVEKIQASNPELTIIRDLEEEDCRDCYVVYHDTFISFHSEQQVQDFIDSTPLHLRYMVKTKEDLKKKTKH